MKTFLLTILFVLLLPLVANAQCANGVCRARPAVRVLVRTPAAAVRVAVPEGRVSRGFLYGDRYGFLRRPWVRIRKR